MKVKTKMEEKKLEYFRNIQRKRRIKNKKCIHHGTQATVKDLLTQELLCDICDKERLVNKYKKRDEYEETKR